jgi:hypothetical protein
MNRAAVSNITTSLYLERKYDFSITEVKNDGGYMTDTQTEAD